MALVTSVIITPDVAASFVSSAAAARPLETGGVLLGRSLEDGTRIISAVINAGHNSKATSATFEPDYEWQQKALNQAFTENPDLEYLGDWHSHPGGRVLPSSTDVQLLTTIRAEPLAQCPNPLMLICGGRRVWVSRAFAFTARGAVRRIPLRIASSSGGD